MKMLYTWRIHWWVGGGRGEKTSNVSDLEYADDMEQVSDSIDALEEVLKILNRLHVCEGMRLTCKKD